MELFQKLGEEIEILWRDKNYDEEIFPSIAAQALKTANLPEKVSAWDVMAWTMNELNLPEQRDLPGRFGDPPITLFNAPRFHVDVYFWLEGTTSIHQHAFCGAFQVLHGSSIHSWYAFDRQEKINTFTEIGTLDLKLCELLNVGDVQTIQAGKQYIHGLFHLEQPSATIVVRTLRSPLHLPQYNYYKPFLALDPFFEEPNTTKKMQCVTSLIRAKHPDTDKFIADWLRAADFQTTFQILSTVRGYLQSNQLDEMFNLSTSQDRFESIMEIVRERHGERANIFPQVFAHQKKVDEIVRLRNFVTEPEHRFFLALLMNVEGKEQIFSLIKERFPDSNPLDKILDWTFDLGQTRVLGAKIPNALGIEDFDDFDLFVLENLLEDKSEEEMREALEAESAPENVEEMTKKLAEKTEKIRQAVIFQPLFANQTASQKSWAFAER